MPEQRDLDDVDTSLQLGSEDDSELQQLIEAEKDLGGAGHAQVCVDVYAIWIMCIFICMPSKRLWALGMHRYVLMCMLFGLCVFIYMRFKRLWALGMHMYVFMCMLFGLCVFSYVCLPKDCGR
jgi:hypothetical protein